MISIWMFCKHMRCKYSPLQFHFHMMTHHHLNHEQFWAKATRSLEIQLEYPWSELWCIAEFLLLLTLWTILLPIMLQHIITTCEPIANICGIIWCARCYIIWIVLWCARCHIIWIVLATHYSLWSAHFSITYAHTYASDLIPLPTYIHCMIIIKCHFLMSPIYLWVSESEK